VKEVISGEAVYHNRSFGLCVDSYVMPGSTADVSAYRSVKFKFFVLNPTPCGVYCVSLPVVQSVFSCPLFIGYGIAGQPYCVACYDSDSFSLILFVNFTQPSAPNLEQRD